MFIVTEYAALMGYFTFEIHAAGNYYKVKMYRPCYKVGSLSLCESIRIDPGQFNTRQFGSLK